MDNLITGHAGACGEGCRHDGDSPNIDSNVIRTVDLDALCARARVEARGGHAYEFKRRVLVNGVWYTNGEIDPTYHSTASARR